MLISKFTFALGVLVTIGFSSAEAENRPLSGSSEPLHFTAASTSKLLRIGKTSDFIGILERTSHSDSVSKNIDVYEFKKTKELQVNNQVCTQILNNIFGDLKTSSFDLKTQEIKSTKAHGKVCRVRLHDSSSGTSIKEKHLFVIIRHFSAYALVMKYSQETAASLADEQWKFIDSLKFSHIRGHSPVTGGT